MRCWNCGTENEAGARFCIQCGAPQARACPSCGHANPAGARFCANCGTPFPDAEPASGDAPVAERRLVSVLFADLVGFTTLAEERDPEETRELLSRYFDIARRTVEGHGGTIEKFIGDAVMAVWGAPTAHEDDAERAVRAALELVGGVPQIQDGGTPLQARAGVLTGEAAVTMNARDQGMVAGDLVNTASRLQSVAPPGTVLVGEATYRAAANAVSFEPAGEQLLKGKAAPVPAWRAVAVVARRGGSGRAAALEPPFVGRDDELQQLKDLFEATDREGKPRLVTIIGQAGIGKSRLAWEFEKYLDGVVATAYWHEGRSPAYGEGTSYWALAEMVRRRAGIAEGEDPGTAREKLAAMLDEFVTDAEERRFIEPRLAGLLGLSALPGESREELFSSWRTLFERIATQAPVIMVFSDLQWADQGLLDFIEDLLGWARSSPILVIGLARPELLERRPDWGASVRSVTRINLEPLGPPDMRELLAGLLPGLPDASLDSICERSEGMPLYAVETVRMLLDTGALAEEDGHYQPRTDFSQLAVAETLHALIAARLDANLPEDRARLQDASVIGQSFSVEALAAVAGSDPVALGEQLDRLVRRQLLVREVDPRSPERGQYRFVQSLVREVAYQSLAREDRRARHLAAARYLETLDEDELAGLLAKHYLAAFAASREGPEADALAAQARVSLQAAAERSAALHSHRQAVDFLEQALTVTDATADRAAIHERIVLAAEPAGEFELGLEHAHTARDLYHELGDVPGALRAVTGAGRMLIPLQREMDAAAELEAEIAAADPAGDVPELARAYAELARAHMFADVHDRSVAAADAALRIPGASTWAVVEALISKGTSLGVMARGTEAEAILRGAIHLADRHGLVVASLRARNNLGGPLSFASLLESEELDEEGFRMATRYGFSSFRHQFVQNLMEKSWRRAAWEAWVDVRDEVLESEHPTQYYQSAALGQRAIRAAILGDIPTAEAELQAAIDVAADLQSTATIIAYPALIRAWIRLVDGRLAEAAENAETAAGNSNFTMDAGYLALLAATAVGDRERMDRFVALYRDPMWPGAVSDAILVVAEKLRALRVGSDGDGGPDDRGPDDGAMADALRALLDGEDLLYAHLGGLLWGELAPGSPAARAAGEAAATFFVERGTGGLVDRFRAAVVREVSVDG